jgi:hypothetical protein
MVVSVLSRMMGLLLILQSSIIAWVMFDEDTLYYEYSNSAKYQLISTLADGFSGYDFAESLVTTPIYAHGSVSDNANAVLNKNTISVGSSSATSGAGLGIYHKGRDDINYGSLASLDSGYRQASSPPTYNTGWMNGDIKLATLSDTDDTNVTGSELVTNGTFDTDTSGWTDYTSSYMTLSHASNAARLTYASNFSAWYGIGQDITTVVGKTYVASYEVTESDSGMEGSYFYLGDSTILYGVSGSPEKSGTITGTFVATSTTTNIRTGHGGAGVGSGDYYTVDNFTVRLAEEDRSVNGNGLQVFGTVTKTFVDEV